MITKLYHKTGNKKKFIAQKWSYDPEELRQWINDIQARNTLPEKARWYLDMVKYNRDNRDNG